ncbi:tRNA-uridine aminocarboxypropyltransferase [Moritella sp. F3]|uniref:tRNA-uridine aminocarboxypropyltransferase n=1 Tax=Moritella sp. F3 TaxID=2718882 RepID=UPI0018E13A22|nr:tRNA-uridine aminocarboxypropyltransferase [Moritella sp. F3]GIC76411.1 DTW domain-containing protein [Moritella sp. F1]GIC80920.1 DTW domain-containing protein [Moritella sp. F3]
MHIYLVTHEREFSRRSNTGKLVQQFLPDETSIVAWRRKEPDSQLLAAIKTGRVAILAPGAEGEHDISDFDSLVLLDSTWQEARKMYSRSDYLKDLPKVTLTAPQASEFILRANQLEGGLSTVECVIELLRLQQRDAEAERLKVEFKAFIRACL